MQSHFPPETPYKWFFKRLISGTAIVAISIFSITAYSGTAYAGLFSFLSNLVDSAQASDKGVKNVPVVNSQNMLILAAAAASLHPTGDDSTEVAPINGGVFVPDIAVANATDTSMVSTEISTYVVQRGDTVTSIAKMFNVSVNTVLWANNLTGHSTLRAGDTLVILPISGISYAVKQGDTLKGIAKKYGADVSDILSYNDLTLASKLTVGQEIIIPDAELAAPPVKPARSSGIKKAPYEPLIGDVSSYPSYPGYYSCPVLPGVGHVTQLLHGHNGIDIGAPVGTPLHASHAGTVIIARVNGGWNGGYGNFVVVSHPNGTQTLYAHMSNASRGVVSVGQQVSMDQIIGYIGMTGMTTGPHVHFEVRGAVNPCVNY